ncbi:MAG: rhomboid family intramembrane serine protease [Leifsonia sp.]
MAQQRATAPKTKPAILTRMSGRGAPVVTYALIGICVVVFVLSQLPGIGSTVQQGIQYAGAYSHPTGSLSSLIAFEPWRMLTTVFAHANFFHIALNMYTLWIFGMLLEPLLGRVRYLALFLISGFAGSLGVLLIANPLQPVVGASGAIFGLFGAFFVIQRRLGGDATQLLVLIGINLVIGFIPAFGIAWQAHVGGLIAGALVGLIYVETRRITRQRWQVPLLAVLSAVLVLLSLVHFL